MAKSDGGSIDMQPQVPISTDCIVHGGKCNPKPPYLAVELILKAPRSTS